MTLSAPCSARSQSSVTGTVVFDFDGTLCLGDGPVRSYARHAYANLAPKPRYEAEKVLDDYLDDSLPAQTLNTYGWQDGYDVVAYFCRDHMAPSQLQNAYLASRTDLARGFTTSHIPSGMKDFLRKLGALGCRRILLSNSPIIGLRETLERFALTDDFDAIVPDASKPSQWPSHLQAFTKQSASEHLLSIGDYWSNDIAPVLAAGYEAAYIHGCKSPGTHPRATYQAPELPDMYDDIIKGCVSWQR